MTIASGAETRANTYTAGHQDGSQITALSDGGWVVTWSSNGQDGSESGVYQQAFHADGTRNGAETQVNTYTTNVQGGQQTTALPGGGWVVTWTSNGQDGSGLGVYQQAFRADGTKNGVETQVNTYTAGNQGEPKIAALSDGGWVVAWESNGQDGSSFGVYQQAFRADGTKNGDETQVNTYTTDIQFGQQITALPGGRWVVTWHSYEQDGSESGVYQQVFNADGTKDGDETQVNSHTTGNQSYPRIAVLSDGGWVVTWDFYEQTGDGPASGVHQQVFNADGTKNGEETLVDSYAWINYHEQQVTALSNGGWVVTWNSFWQDGSGWGVYQQAFNADGTKNGTEIQANTYTAGDQAGPQVTALSNGGWVVTWTSVGQDGSGWGVYQQVFNADGTKNGVETQVNTYTAGNQGEPRITALSDGSWVVAWTSFGQEGSGSDVYQRSFWLNDAPVLANAIADLTAAEDDAFSFTFAGNTFTDANALDTLTYTATLADGNALPAWLSFDAATRTFSGTPANGDVGAISIRLTATDTSGLSATADFTLTVENTNDAPTLPQDATASTFENAALSIDVLSGAHDDDGDTLTITEASVRSGFGSVFIRDGKLVYDPTTAPNQDIAAGESRLVTVRYTVSDGKGGTATADIAVTVKGVSPDIFKGTAGKDSLKGSIHDDILHGYAGDDTLDGGRGADRMHGGTGNDTYVVDNAGDRVIEKAKEGTDLVKASVSHTLSSHVENLTLTGSKAIDGTGNGSANTITGNSAGNTLKGGGGNDILDGGAGADRMHGGAGNDTYVVGNSGDRVIEKAKEGTDLVKSSVSHALSAHVENLTLTGSKAIDGTGNSLANVLTGNSGRNALKGGSGDDRLHGGSGNDSLEGGSGTDLLKGDGGDDRLYGGMGADTLHGGAGKDTFVFKSVKDSTVKASGRDTIADFSRKAGDRIDLKAIDANTTKGGDQAFKFIGAEKFHAKAGELRYAKKGGDTYVQGDVDGDGGADFSIRLDLGLSMAKADFIL